MDEYQLSETEIAALRFLHRTLKKKREADRVKAVYMLGAGYDIHTVAFVLDIDCDTVKNYFTRYSNSVKMIFINCITPVKNPISHKNSKNNSHNMLNPTSIYAALILRLISKKNSM